MTNEELIAAGLRHAEGLTAQLDRLDWKPSRAHIEQARNSILKLATALRALPAQGEPAAIFEECAEIALEHVEINCEGDDDPEMYVRGYDQACRDIAEAIRLRASNRKTMDAIADAALKP